MPFKIVRYNILNFLRLIILSLGKIVLYLAMIIEVKLCSKNLKNILSQLGIGMVLW